MMTIISICKEYHDNFKHFYILKSTNKSIDIDCVCWCDDRTAVRRGETVKYLLQDSVIDYIDSNGLYVPPQPPASFPRSLGLSDSAVIVCECITNPTAGMSLMSPCLGAGGGAVITLTTVDK